MRRIDRWMALALVGLLTLCLIGCGGETASKGFDDCLDEMLAEDLRAGGLLSAHYAMKDPEKLGITDIPVDFGHISVEEMEKETERTRAQLKKLESFDKKNLTASQQLDYDAIKWYLELHLSGSEFDLFYEPNSATLGIQTELPVMLMEYRFYSEQDILDYLELLKAVDGCFRECIAFQQEKAKAGLFMSDNNAQDVIDGCLEFIEDPQNNALITAFDEKIADTPWLTQEKKAEYCRQNRLLVQKDVIPAYRYLADAFDELKGSGKNPGGVCGFENGKAYYEYIVKEATCCDETVEEIIAWIEDDMESIFSDVMRLALSDSRLLDQLESAVLDVTDPEEILPALQDRIKSEYLPLDGIKYSVHHVPKSMEENMSPAFYLLPPIDATDENRIYLNNKYTDGDEMYLFTTLAHEGYPGHLYQTNWFYSGDAHNYRKLIPGFTGYVEGWATYVEYHSYELSGVEKGCAELLALDSRLSLALQCRVDIGVNYEGWDAEDVEKYLRKYGLGDGIGQTMVDFVAADPANSLSYYVGYLQFEKLRKYAEEELGNDFDAAEFHAAVLDIGNAPFWIVEQQIEEYVAKKKQ